MTRKGPEPPLDALSRGSRALLGRSLTDTEQALFLKYLDLLTKWQKSHRLIGSHDLAWIVENLILDSLLFLQVLPSSVSSVLDFGSGAGVPGIPIKIVKPDVKLILVESRRRRASFLSTVVRELGIEDTRVIAGRVEEFMGDLAGSIDAVVMRCAGDPEILFPTAAQLVSASGIVVASGPPEPKPTALGQWLTVEDRARGRPRSFLVYRHT